MEYDVEKKQLILNKELNNLDKFVIDFINCLDNYVIVSGYVSILLGRSRATEDVDLLIPEMNFKEFNELWEKLNKEGFECINTPIPENAFNMIKEHAIRFSKKNVPVPNIEFKVMKTDLDKYSFENKLKVIINNNIFLISPLELQIAYKLFLAADGTDEELIPDKDIEDAKHLYKLFEEKINKEELLLFVNKLNIKKRMRFLE